MLTFLVDTAGLAACAMRSRAGRSTSTSPLPGRRRPRMLSSLVISTYAATHIRLGCGKFRRTKDLVGGAELHQAPRVARVLNRHEPREIRHASCLLHVVRDDDNRVEI